MSSGFASVNSFQPQDLFPFLVIAPALPKKKFVLPKVVLLLVQELSGGVCNGKGH